MTKDRARKRAARQRAEVTGERYVVARRGVSEQTAHEAVAMPGGVLHRLTHRVPGVPEHVDGGAVGRRNQPHHNRPHHPSARVRHRHGEPRVLVAWQRRIARLFGAE